MAAKIQILLATYNGAAYLPAQLESLTAQTEQDWEILARDDGSTDCTVDLLAAFKETHPNKITILKDYAGTLKPAGNFSALMECSRAPYISLCDQDDVWHADKLERSLKVMRAVEEEHGTHMPVLVHHDFTQIDKDGTLRYQSFDKHYNTGKQDTDPDRMIMRPVVHGFSAMANRALLDKALPIPQKVDMHDSHLCRVSSMFGKLVYIPEQLADYRVHGANSSWNQRGRTLRISDFALDNLFNGEAFTRVKERIQGPRRRIAEKAAIASEFLARYGDELAPAHAALLREFADMAEGGFFRRRAMLMKHDCMPHTVKGFIGTLIFA